MWRIEDTLVLSEEKEKEKGGLLGPGFRFHPTDEELIKFYLASKVFHHHIPPHNNSRYYSTFPFEIAQLDLNRCEPWDLPERARMGEREWYFYSLRDRKYPTGLRTNRATGTGYWKATGKDRQVFATVATTTTTVSGGGAVVIGMKKTLVFYQGRAPRGVKTRWVMHEYRLDGHFPSFRLSCSKEEWVICRIFHKHGGEKKHTPSTPFLHGSLPPVLEVPTTSSPPPTPRVAMDCPLNSLLNHLPPLINLSTLSSSQGTTTTTIVAATATSVDPLPPPVLFHHHPQPPTTTITAPTNWYDNVNVPVDVDISASVAALDSLLDPDPIKLTAQSWPFHP